jgi:hypothetical protein
VSSGLGGPYIKKPRFFSSRESWEKFDERDGFTIEKDDPVGNSAENNRTSCPN